MSGRGNRIDKGHNALILKAIAKGGLSFVVQPIHDAKNIEEILYAECLARVTDAEGVVHTAGTFVPQLERLDGRFDLDFRMLDMILTALMADTALTLGCNLSAATLSAPDRFADIFSRISHHKPELTSRLVVEITETYPLVGAAIERLKMIRALGCRVAIDDFGAGFATPAHLLQVSADIVKVDASFVRDIRPGSDGRDSLYHLVGFASCLAPLVIVEGIETEAQLEAARSTGATHAQGFLLSKPVALQQLPRKKGKFGLREVG
ncbi:EAL domain-containing protein [Rhizobium sp. CB3090]|uniref:EAL domain-containing protein n=1 Tax=Rhizobium sp. CB3090 TaxID=3039156 RepID=UPI0024B15DE1|nr:EAL domain-containing protein [Rhizobium sp. CB3090]WFU09026.1 EAL domain-containing protein [Rhizobium sp. CB3090]